MPQNFEEEYHCFPAAFAENPRVEEGDKILLPASALDTLTRLNIQCVNLRPCAGPRMSQAP